MPGSRQTASSPTAAQALVLVEGLQKRFVDGLDRLAQAHDPAVSLTPVEWLRDEGRHGGGVRYEVADGTVFNRASVNVSQVHYDDLPEKRLASASAISTIIHPQHPRAPSMHMHISFTEMRDGSGYWRVMADLNPSNPDDDDQARFEDALKQAAPDHYDEAKAQGERYFFIPALGRHRGVSHFYLEAFETGDFERDAAFARGVGEATIDRYLDIVGEALDGAGEPTAEQLDHQLAYHTLYLFQVLTLDRGTTSGLLVHDQNDVGIMGSLPSHVDRDLLASWAAKVEAPQEKLVEAIVAELPAEVPTPVGGEVRGRLARAVRAHYKAHPEALDLQARGHVVPPTVQNHR